MTNESALFQHATLKFVDDSGSNDQSNKPSTIEIYNSR